MKKLQVTFKTCAAELGCYENSILTSKNKGNGWSNIRILHTKFGWNKKI